VVQEQQILGYAQQQLPFLVSLFD